MKLRAIAPALLAVVALGVVYVLVARDDGSPAAPPAQKAAHEPSATPTPAPAPVPTPTPALEPGPVPGPAPDPAPNGEGPTGVPHALTPEEYAGHEPKAKKPKMTLEEKLAETTKHIRVMERRAVLIKAEIANLEQRGETQKAAEQRIVLERLEAHAEKLRQAVAEGREPE